MKIFVIALLLCATVLVAAQKIESEWNEEEAEDKGDAETTGSRGLSSSSIIGYCPAYKHGVYQKYCTGKKCPEKKCIYKITMGYYCGLPYSLRHPLYVWGIGCKYYTKCGLGQWPSCECSTKYCWAKYKRVVKHYYDSRYYWYIVYVDIKIPCGCLCMQVTYYG